jgi:hypothetical protein
MMETDQLIYDNLDKLIEPLITTNKKRSISDVIRHYQELQNN